MKRLIIVFSAVVLLTGCAVTGKEVEMPKEGTGTDEMKKKPLRLRTDPFQQRRL